MFSRRSSGFGSNSIRTIVRRILGHGRASIARYEILAFRTRAARSRIQFSQDFIDRVSSELAQAADESDTRLTLLEECRKKLTEWQRNLLWRCCVAGDSTKKVASQLGRNHEATRKALLRIRRTLYRCIEDAQQKEAES